MNTVHAFLFTLAALLAWTMLAISGAGATTLVAGEIVIGIAVVLTGVKLSRDAHTL